MPELHRLDNGLTVCIEHIDGVESVAMHALVPAGSALDTDDTDGIAALHGEMLLRGDATRSTRVLSDQMDRAGLSRSVSVGTQHLHLHGTTTGARALEAIDLMVSVLIAPAMPESDLEAAANLCLQAIASLEDDPEEVAVVELQRRHRPPPLHRSGLGDEAVISAAQSSQLHEAWAQRAGPRGSLLAIAGHVDGPRLLAHLEGRVSDWTGSPAGSIELRDPLRGRVHLARSTSQVHFAIAMDAPKAADADAEAARLAAMVLGGGSASRLFLEVRQRRSLCYGIGARWHGGRDDGFIQIVTGTMPERAAETLATTCSTIRSAVDDMTDDDIDRAMLQVRSGMVRSGESTRARAGALARDAIMFDEVRSLPERLALVEQVRPEDVRAVAHTWSHATPTIVAVGPDETPIWD